MTILHRSRHNPGFTLVELLVTLSIIGVLLSLSLAAINSTRVRGRDAKRIADLRTIQAALEQHVLGDASHAYPPDPTASNTTTYCAKYGGNNKGLYANKCFTDYLSVVPKNVNNQPYEYKSPGCFNADTGAADLSGVKLTNNAVETQCGIKFSKSYGLHVALESDKNVESAQDASPDQKLSYDLIP